MRLLDWIMPVTVAAYVAAAIFLFAVEGSFLPGCAAICLAIIIFWCPFKRNPEDL